MLVINLVSFVLRRFCKIHRYKQGEDHRLYKSNKYLQQIKWYDHEITYREKSDFYKTAQPYHHAYQDNACKNISKETKREG